MLIDPLLFASKVFLALVQPFNSTKEMLFNASRLRRVIRGMGLEPMSQMQAEANKDLQILSSQLSYPRYLTSDGRRRYAHKCANSVSL